MNNNKYQRKDIRLNHYDYAQEGQYFITICAQNRVKYFGEINEGKFIANDCASTIEKLWLEMAVRFPFIVQHQYVFMPNHFHAILEIKSANDTTLGMIIGAFKSLSSNAYIKGVRENNWLVFNKRLWQRNYYEHVIRNDESYMKLSEYIENNPLKWEDDMFFM